MLGNKRNFETAETTSTNAVVLANVDENEKKRMKTNEFARYITKLNKQIQAYFLQQIQQDPFVDLSNAAQDYIDYAKDLENRYLKKYGEVLTFGSGDCGQLAHGIDRDEDLMVKYPRIVYSLRNKKVCAIACGGLHNAVVTDAGEVYSWGCSDDGSLGRVGDESMPLLVDSLAKETIVAVACGDGQTIALSAGGDVYGWGCYKDKEGKKWFNPPIESKNPLKEINNQQNVAIKIGGLANIVEIVCGSSFCLARTSNGRVFSWGVSECGELGRHVTDMKKKGINKDGEEDMIYDVVNILQYHLTPDYMQQVIEPLPVDNNNRKVIENVKSIGCGSYHSFVITVGNVLYSCGLNNYAQLGFSDNHTRHVLHEVTALFDKEIVTIRGGIHHSLALTKDNLLYSFGRGDSGQLGSIEFESKTAGDFSNRPLLVTLPPKSQQCQFTSIACGGNHNLVLSKDNDVYTWGYGDMLALGHGEEKDELLPRKLNFSKSKIGNIAVTQVSGGGQHSALIGEVWSST